MRLWTVSDNENDNMLYPCTSENMANEFCKLLNELNDENKHLQKENKLLKEKLNEILELTELTGMTHLRKAEIKSIIKR